MKQSGFNRQGLRGLLLILLIGSLAGCRHAPPPPPPPAATAPAPKPAPAPASITVITPLPSVPPQSKPNVQPAAPDLPAPKEAPVTKSRRRHREHGRTDLATKNGQPTTPHEKTGEQAPENSASATEQGKAQSNSQETSQTPSQDTSKTAQPSGTPDASGTASLSPNAAAAEKASPALGQLSTGTAITNRERTRLLGEIQSLERRLARLKRLSTIDSTALRMQVKTFLARAREAVGENDLDGAQTLDTKARVLISELENQ